MIGLDRSLIIAKQSKAKANKSLPRNVDFAEFVRACWFATYNSGSWQTIGKQFNLSARRVGNLIETLRSLGADMPYNLHESKPAYNPKKSFRNSQLEEQQSQFLAKLFAERNKK